MKYIISLVLLAVAIVFIMKAAGVSFLENPAEKALSKPEQELFSFILKTQPQDMIMARPMRLEQTGNALTIYCEYLGDKSQEAREDFRKKLYTEIQKWNEAQPTKYEYIFIKFTDEVISPMPPK